MEAFEFESSKKDSKIKLRIYRILVGIFVGISLSCSHQTLHWLLLLISQSNQEGSTESENANNAVQSVVYYFIEAFFFFTVAPFAIMSDNVLIISTCLLVQFLFYITVTTALNFFTSNIFLQYMMTVLFAFSRSILFGRLLVMMKNWFSQKRLVLYVGLTYFLNEFFSLFSTYWDVSDDDEGMTNSVKDRLIFICLLLSTILGLIIQGKPSIMGLKMQQNQNGVVDSDNEEEEDVDEQKDKVRGGGGIISNFWGLDESYVKKVFNDDEHDALGNRKLSIFKQILQIKKILFFIISSICLKLLDWYTGDQIQGSLQVFQKNNDFDGYLIVFAMYGAGGLAGVVTLGLLLDVYSKEFTLRMAILSVIGLSISYVFSLLYYNDYISQYVFMIFAGYFEFSFYCTYQVGVPIVLVFDLMRYGDFSFLIIPLFSGLDRLVNALYNTFNDNPKGWTTASTIVQPICIAFMFISLLIQYLRDRQRSTNQANNEVEDEDDQVSEIRPYSAFLEDDRAECGMDASHLRANNSRSRHGTINNFKISISNDDEPAQDIQEHFKNSLEQETKFVIEKKNLKIHKKQSSDYD